MGHTHQEINKRSLALHRLVARKLRRDNSLFERVRAFMARWRSAASPNERYYLDEWTRLVDLGLDTALAVATEDSPYATALRQSAPFTGILTPEERAAFLDQWAQAQGANPKTYEQLDWEVASSCP